MVHLSPRRLDTRPRSGKHATATAKATARVMDVSASVPPIRTVTAYGTPMIPALKPIHARTWHAA